MSLNPLISVVTPSYNQGRFIEKAILSVANQSYRNLEYIIIDGGSTDQTLDVLNKHSSLIDFWVSEPDMGQSHALNKGFSRATGDIICWLNSDDYFLPDTLEVVAEEFSNNKLDILIGQSYNFYENGKHILAGFFDDLVPRLLVGQVCPQPSTFFTRSSFLKVGGLDESLHYTMDWDLFARIGLIGNIKTMDKVLSYQLLHPGGKMIKNSHLFCVEGSSVFCDLLYTLNGTDWALQIASSLGYNGRNRIRSPISCQVELCNNDIKLALLLFLRKMAHHEYQTLNLPQARRILSVALRLDHRFYLRSNLYILYLRSLMPPNLILSARSVARGRSAI